jgi:hypothetical protein
MLEEETLRLAYAEAETSVPHLSEETWERFAFGELSVEERERALEHVSRCVECARVLRALSLLEAEARAIDPAVPARLSAPAEPSRRRGLLWTAAAAAAAVALWLTLPSFPPGRPAPGSPSTDSLRSATGASRPVPKSPLDRVASAPEGFSWEGTEGARAYRVELLDADGESIWTSGEVAETRVPWPRDVASDPGRYYWRVVAILAERGETVASPLVSVDLRP